MAVFRVTSRTENRQAAKASVRYIENAHRREEDKNAPPRYLFGRDGERLTRYQAYRVIDKASWGTTIFRIALSPDRITEDINKDLDLKELTEMTMLQLQSIFPKQTISYIAAIHTNTKNRHVHILAMLPVKHLPKAELTRLIDTATKEAQEQRRLLDRDIAPSPAQSFPLIAGVPVRVGTSQRLTQYRTQASSRKTGSITSQYRKSDAVLTAPTYSSRRTQSCPNCGPNHEMERYGRRYECPSCGLRLKNTGLGVEIIKRPGLELDLEGVGTT